MGIDDDNIDSFDDQSTTNAEGVTSAGESPTMTAALSQLASVVGSFREITPESHMIARLTPEVNGVVTLTVTLTQLSGLN